MSSHPTPTQGTPGLLVVKKALLTNRVPATPGGGTVFYVTEQGHRYLQNLEEREEGGTPSILGVVRAGLVFQLWAAVGGKQIRTREAAITRRVLEAWGAHPAIRLLGNVQAPRMPVVSLMIEHGGKLLHWNFVSTLLSDLFGIQVCAAEPPSPTRSLARTHTHTSCWLAWCAGLGC
jgi:selenocysteine lyase/cysteine desulfurase